MHSFHHSRGRILVEVLCALTVGASCYVGWMQTGASALLPAAAAIALYSLVRLTDLRSPKPAHAVELQPVCEPEPTVEIMSETFEPAAATEPVVDVAPGPAEAAVEAEPAKPKTPRASKPRRTKTMRKGGRRASDESVPFAATEIPVVPEENASTSPAPVDEVVHSNIEPLFEPEPFVRMPRPAFGRKAG